MPCPGAYLAEATLTADAAASTILATASGRDTYTAWLPGVSEGALRSVLTGASVTLHFVVRGDPRPLRLDLETTALRIGREAVVNVIKHAGAGKVEVVVDYDAKFLRLQIRDDGKGMPPGTAEAASLGDLDISGMRSRAQRAAGTMEIVSEPGAGTIIQVSLPTS